MKTILLSVVLVFTALVSFGQWSYDTLIIPREFMGGAAVGNKVYFAGGSNDDGYWGIVEVHDLSTGAWDIAGNLSVDRAIISGVSCGSWIFFAGGFDYNVSYNTVDIYNTVTHVWSVTQLSVARFSLGAVSYGSKVYFAGGVNVPPSGEIVYKSVVDIYDTLTGWETSINLSQAREAIAAAVVGDKAIFAGGITSNGVTGRVDIYNFTDNTWEQAELSQARSHASATTVGAKVIIAGGSIDNGNPTDRVDIYDASNGTWDTATLSVPRAAFNNGATVHGKAYFAGGGSFTGSGFNNPQNIIDIYDPENDTWTTDVLMEKLVKHSVLGIGNYLVVAGGKNDQGNIVSTVEIFYDPETGISSQSKKNAFFTIHPNPCNNILTFNTPNGLIIDDAVIYSQAGHKVLQRKPINNTLDISKLQHGMYIIEMITEQRKIREKLIIH
jgi:hypothetical protein